MGWLHASPPLPKNSTAERLPRCRALESTHPAFNMPVVAGCNDVLSAFNLSGYVMSGGMGATPLTWQEIQSLNEGAGLFLGSWAMRQVRSMSESYCRLLNQSSEKDIPPPWVDNYGDYRQYMLQQSERNMLARRINP